MAGSRGRRWARRVVVLGGALGAALVYRDRRIADNARRFGLPT